MKALKYKFYLDPSSKLQSNTAKQYRKFGETPENVERNLEYRNLELPILDIHQDTGTIIYRGNIKDY